MHHPDDTLTHDLRETALGMASIDLMGVAAAERLDGAPEGNRPSDYLPGATSVVVLAAKIPDGAIEVAGHYDEPGKTLGPYMWYGYVVPNWDLSSAAAGVARFLEKRGFRALPFPPTGINYKFGSRADFSHRHAAVAAGLGDFGLSGLVLTPEFGARQRFVSIITDASLDPSPLYDGAELCRPDLCGEACVRACPTKAIGGRVSLTIGDKTCEYARVQPVKCIWPFPENGYRRTKAAMPTDPTEDDFRAVLASTKPHPYDAALNQFTFVPQCGACLFRCPSPRFAGDGSCLTRHMGEWRADCCWSLGIRADRRGAENTLRREICEI
ncbi:MAG: epoxyqueuosine reductase [Actinobacteria bacterium]|nr:epoxyqueuosine reductase [Actinomycetota bacterium]